LDQKIALNSMVSGLNNCDDPFYGRVCNPGKAQNLVVAVLQGRLKDVCVDGAAAIRLTTANSMEMFFKRAENRAIESRGALLAAANLYCDQNPLILREAFLVSINQYADAQEMK
jgi:hypothetical protein